MSQLLQNHKQSPLEGTRHRKKQEGRFLLLLPIILSDVSLLMRPDTFLHPSIGTWVILLLGMSFIIVFFACTYPAYYEITPSAVFVRSGLMRQVIPLTSIQKVYPSHFVPDAKWPLSQLRIYYKPKNLSSLRFELLAPRDETAFLHDLGVRARELGIGIEPFHG